MKHSCLTNTQEYASKEIASRSHNNGLLVTRHLSLVHLFTRLLVNSSTRLLIYKLIVLLIAVVNCLSVAVAQTDSLHHYLKIAGQNNAEVKAAFLRYEASLQKTAQMGAYEDPQLEMGFFLEPMDIVGGREIAQFQLMQMFPWFGTKKAARTEARHMAKMAFEEFREVRDNLFLEVYMQWFVLCNLQQRQINSEENRKLLLQLETLALQKFASGGSFSGKTEKRETEKGERGNAAGRTAMSGMNMENTPLPGNSVPQESMSNMSGMNMGGTSPSGLSEVLRIQLEIVEIESNIESILSEIIAAKARFNALLNRPLESEVHIPSQFSQLFYLFDVDKVLQAVREQNPMLGMIRQEALAYGAKGEMERKMGYPMFGIGLQYMLIGKTPPDKAGLNGETVQNGHAGESMNTSAIMLGMNGKDMIMPMLSVSIPIFRNKYKAARKESRLLRQASEEKYFNTQNMLEASLYGFKHQLDDALRKIKLYRKQSELARTAYELVVGEFTSGKSDLGAVVQVQRQLLDYQLKESEAIAAYNTAVVNIQKLTAQWSVDGVDNPYSLRFISK
ncbi:MAG: TolC family protein [Dysgonamonadaceae bacterium]|jgi:outer membrane protein TolC|nr:TolC family protein [Dysgonamonadaceae bacterium]